MVTLSNLHMVYRLCLILLVVSESGTHSNDSASLDCDWLNKDSLVPEPKDTDDDDMFDIELAGPDGKVCY